MLRFALIIALAVFLLGCSVGRTEIITVVVTATPESVTVMATSMSVPVNTPTVGAAQTPTVTATLSPTATAVPTSTPLPTPTPINSDCVDCPVVAVGRAGALLKYERKPVARYHTEKVLLVVCGRGYSVEGLGEVMGGMRSLGTDDVFVKGVEGMVEDECVAITAKYIGLTQDVVSCLDFGSGCPRGAGLPAEVFMFEKVGQMTSLAYSQYSELYKRRPF